MDFGAEQADRDEALAVCDERLMETMLDRGILTDTDLIPATGGMCFPAGLARR